MKSLSFRKDLIGELFSKLFNYCILLYINYLIRQNNHSIQ